MTAGGFYPEERRFVEELSKHFTRTAYLNGIGVRGFRPHQLAAIVKRLRHTHEPGRRGQTIDIRSLLIIPERRAARALNVRWLERQLRRIAMPSPDRWAIWTRVPSKELVAAIDRIPFGCVVYEPIDSYADHPGFSTSERKRIRSGEAMIIKRAPVIAAADTVARRLRSAAGGCHWLPLGMDGRAARNVAAKPRLPTVIGRPRLLVIGTLDWRIDLPLIENLAIRRPEWHLVLAGPEVSRFPKEVKSLANIHFLGPIPTDQSAAVIADCDVALIPYKLTPWTIASLPLKVFDYLAAGKPVVCTQLPELS